MRILRGRCRRVRARQRRLAHKVKRAGRWPAPRHKDGSLKAPIVLAACATADHGEVFHLWQRYYGILVSSEHGRCARSVEAFVKNHHVSLMAIGGMDCFASLRNDGWLIA